MSTNPILKCSGIVKNFKKKNRLIQVLKGVDLEIFPGEITVIKGKSGEGKTVLQWILSGIDSPSSGEMQFEGTSFNNYSREEFANIRRNKIGLIFQNFHLIQSWTALENVESAMINSDLSYDERFQKAVAILNKLGLGERLDNLPIELSEGQQQRVAIARALINEPVLIIADEPTGNVDDETASDILNILVPYIKDRGSAMVVTTHGIFTGEHLANRVFYLKDGVLTDVSEQN